MVPSLGSALSALQAFGRKLGITAGNIANLDTDGFTKSRGLLREGAGGGVTLAEPPAAPPRSAPGPEGAVEAGGGGGAPVELTEEIPELITSVYGFRANLKTVKVQDDLLGRLLDTLA